MGYVYICCVCAGTYRRGGWKPQEEEEEEEVVIYMTAHARVEKSSFLFRPLFHYTFFRWPCCCLFYLFLYFFICICLGRLLGLPRDVASPSFAHHLRLCPTAAAPGEVRNPTARNMKVLLVDRKQRLATSYIAISLANYSEETSPDGQQQLGTVSRQNKQPFTQM